MSDRSEDRYLGFKNQVITAQPEQDQEWNFGIFQWEVMSYDTYSWIIIIIHRFMAQPIK